MTTKFTPQRTKDPIIDRNLDQLQKVTNEILALPLFGFSYLKGIVLDTTDTVVSHGLGRPYQGFILVLSDAGEVVYVSPTVNTNKAVEIILLATGTVTVDLWVF